MPKEEFKTQNSTTEYLSYAQRAMERYIFDTSKEALNLDWQCMKFVISSMKGYTYNYDHESWNSFDRQSNDRDEKLLAHDIQYKYSDDDPYPEELSGEQQQAILRVVVPKNTDSHKGSKKKGKLTDDNSFLDGGQLFFNSSKKLHEYRMQQAATEESINEEIATWRDIVMSNRFGSLSAHYTQELQTKVFDGLVQKFANNKELIETGDPLKLIVSKTGYPNLFKFISGLGKKSMDKFILTKKVLSANDDVH